MFEKRNQHLSISSYCDQSEVYKVMVDTNIGQEMIISCFQQLVRRCLKHLDPVVQSIVSLTISLRHKFVKQISAKVTNTLLFFVEKM